MTRTYEIPDSLDQNVRLLAERVLTGDTSAVRPMIDAFLETDRTGQTLTAGYAERLEDTLHAFKSAVLKGTVGSDEYGGNYAHAGDCLMRASKVKALQSAYFTIEREAKTLNRSGLS